MLEPYLYLFMECLEAEAYQQSKKYKMSTPPLLRAEFSRVLAVPQIVERGSRASFIECAWYTVRDNTNFR